MSKSKFSLDEKLRIIKMCENKNGRISLRTFLKKWRLKYLTYGSSVLCDWTEWTGYLEELKMKAILEVLIQEESLTRATVSLIFQV